MAARRLPPGLPRGLRLLAVAGLVAAALPAWSLDLAKAHELALARDAQVAAARAAAAAGRERLPQARAQLLPTLNASVSRARNDLDTTAPNFLGESQTTNSTYNSANNTLSLRQPLFRPQLWAQYRQARFQVEDTDAQYEVELVNLTNRVTQQYFQALLAQDQLEVVRQQKLAMTTQLDAAQRSLQAGVGTRTDVDDARARLDMTVAQELELTQALDLARRELSLTIGEPAGALAALDPRKLVLAPPEPAGMDAWVERAETASPELRALRARLEASREEVAKAKAGHAPTVDAFVQRSRSESENVTRISSIYDQRQVGVQVNIPLYQGGYVNSQMREAIARRDQVESQLEAARRDLGVRVLREFRGVSEGVLKVRALEQAVRSAEELVTSNQRSFQAGVRTRVDILNAEQQLATARRDLAQARYVYLASKVRLAALAGQDSAAAIADVSKALAP